MESKNIFNLNKDEQSNLSSKPERQFENPQDEQAISESNSLAKDAAPLADELVGSNGKLTDEDSSLTKDTDTAATPTVEDDLDDEGLHT
jgi:hypothetical protein